jgi:hypothetical protein
MHRAYHRGGLDDDARIRAKGDCPAGASMPVKSGGKLGVLIPRLDR